jgi:hypothetical protein
MDNVVTFPTGDLFASGRTEPGEHIWSAERGYFGPPPPAASITLPPDTPIPTGAPAPAGVTLNDFVAYLPEHTYIFLPNGKHWPKESINSVIPPMPLINKCGLPVTNDKGKQVMISASEWLDQNQPVHDMTWAPGEPELIEDKITCEGG